MSRRVFITGASSGLGAGFARWYAGSGRTLGLVARRGELLDRLASELRQTGSVVHVFAGDVGHTGWMREVIGNYLAEARGIDLAIANAGIGASESLKSANPESVALLLRTNVIGVTNTLLPFVAPMLAQGHGTLVAVGSVAGYRGLPTAAHYCASKAAILTLMEGLRMEVAGTGVHAMTLCPGFVRTAMSDASQFRRPFLLELEAAVALMTRAIERRCATYTFPWQMRLLSGAMRVAPEWFVRRALVEFRREA